MRDILPYYTSAEVRAQDVPAVNQRGFIQLSMMAWGAIAAGAVMLGLVVALKVQTHRLESLRAEYAEFKANVEAIGKAAEKTAKDKEAKDKSNKEKADAEKKRLTADLAAALKRVRDSRSSGGGLSAPAPAADSADRTCFDPAKLATALRNLDAGILGIVESGSQAVSDLDTAKSWAEKLTR